MASLPLASSDSHVAVSSVVCAQNIYFFGPNAWGPVKEAMPVAIACLEQEDLGFDVLCWEWKVICAEKIVDGRVPLPARSGYISENRGTVLEKSRRGRVYPAICRTPQGESGRRPISCVRFTL